MATITQLATTENGTDSRTIINTNFTNVNNELVTASSDIDTAQTDITALQNTRALKAGDTFTGQVKLAKGADLASAATVDLGAATGNYVDITGTTTITSFGTTTAGTTVKVRFSGILTLTHNATSLILPSGANITTAANDTAEFVSLGSGNWRCTIYTKANGLPVVATTDIVGLTEDTAGDMDADFAIVYDNSAGANRKQKVNVFRATNAESLVNTTNNKFLTPSSLKYNKLYADNTFYVKKIENVDEVGFSDSVTGTGSSVNVESGYIDYSRIYAGASSGAYARTWLRLPGYTASLATLPAPVELDLKNTSMHFNAGTSTNGVGFWGLTDTNSRIIATTSFTTVQTLQHIGFFFTDDAATLTTSISVANGSTQTISVIGGQNPSTAHSYRINYVSGTVLFYIDGSLVGTITTNIPDLLNNAAFYTLQTSAPSGTNACTLYLRTTDYMIKYS